ncbi:DUF4317 family protein [Ruminococcus sp.]|uniref:DUF4317 family protein n=1 Tax=Ruminococcus sp. TaxID=41978 RepID=UPI001B499D2B|nr:DUF4317 family protein [Ruminococcus sp.]MBP5433768.1 DUF4317 family protein [Ruminococcus sp.]
MNRKEINEIKKNLKSEDGFLNFNKFLITIVNADHEVEMQRVVSPLMASEREERVYRDILLHTMNGNVGKKSVQIDFEPGEQGLPQAQQALYDIVQTAINSDEALAEYTNDIILTYPSALPYAVITAHCTYTVRHRRSDDSSDEDNTEEFKFIVSAYCPVCTVDSGFSYDFGEKKFSTEEDKKLHIIPKPLHGLFYPAFDDRSANVNSAMVYVAKQNEFPAIYIEDGLGCKAPVSAKQEKEHWLWLLRTVFGDELSYPFLFTINELLIDASTEYSRDTRLTQFCKSDLAEILEMAGATAEQLSTFDKSFDYLVSTGSVPGYLYLQNLIDSRFTFKTSEYTVSCSVANADSVSTTVIDGSRSFQLRTSDMVMDVNGATVTL